MKKLITILSGIMLMVNSFSQAPEKFSYQAVVRDATDNLVVNSTTPIKISLLKSTITGTVVYEETHTPTTNANGLLSIEIGGGTVLSGIFENIDWGGDKYFVKTEIDVDNNASYDVTGTSQLLSVPYALHAKTADSLAGLSSANLADLIALVTPPQIGDFRHGGIVFWIDPSDPWSGLVCAVDDQTAGTTVRWSNNTSVTGAFDTIIGSGQSNTTMIVASQGLGVYAAKMCDDLTLNGFSDWFLPSKHELNEMYINKTTVENASIANGGTGFGLHYWSSSEINGNANLSVMQSFSFGAQYNAAKLNSANVRAVRAF